mgnify:CR=1 FL=1
MNAKEILSFILIGGNGINSSCCLFLQDVLLSCDFRPTVISEERPI